MKKFFKIAVLCQLILALVTGVGFCFIFDLKPMTKEEIHKLKEEKLKDAYIDVMIELEAANKFYSNSGFKPKEYEQYRALLRFRTDLIIEFEEREVEPPRIK